MAWISTSYKGVRNIIRFNWPFYAFSSTATVFAWSYAWLFLGPYPRIALIIGSLIALQTIISLAVSHLIYDRSDLYNFDRLLINNRPACVVNINAGFDETSALLAARLHPERLLVFDFYDPLKHTEASIARARRIYPPDPGTISATTAHIPLADNQADLIFLFFAAHEIRATEERNQFFKELFRMLSADGRIIIMEHLRDLPNALAYNIGALHFLPERSWLRSFEASGLTIENRYRHTPFITVFVLRKKC